ncbi:putative reverse transcriptase domain-containing protein [Tanacetum coccineum]|uniref:Reverse transcriptase domain-containing protein n=1 Tax=Tanacetum coccineum TaxID=301880 RepID=A0ABQ5IPQ8_9ASTR
MACSLPHTIDEIKALVEKLIDEDIVRQKAIMELVVQFDNACTTKEDMKKAYEKCNDIPQENCALIDTFLKQESDKDYEMHNAFLEIMSPHTRKKFRWGIVVPTGLKRYTDLATGLRMKRTNRKCRIPIDLYPCRVEEKLIMRKVEGKWIMKKEMRMISKDGTISEFHGYTSSNKEEEKEDEEEDEEENKEEDEEVEKEESEKKRSNEAAEIGSNSEPLGYAAIDNEVESDLESTTRSEPKCKEMEDTCVACGRVLSNKEMEKLESEFWNHTIVEANHAGYTDRFHELAKLVPRLVTPESKRIVRDCRAPVKQVAPVSIVRMGDNQRVCYECGSSEHLRNTCPKLNRAPGQVRNRLALEGNRNTQNNENQARGRAFSVNAVDTLADFSFISTKFASLLNVKPSIVCPGYVIEVANGKKEEVDRIIRDCKLEIGNSLFTIDLIPLGHGSFDVIVGMDWLSKNKAEIVCHEKVVRIPLKCGEVLRVQVEHTLGGTKTLMSTKAEEPELSDIPIIRDFNYVYPEDLSGLPLQRQVEFRIDLIS